MKKYYITCGDLEVVTHAHTEPQAIFIALDTLAEQTVDKLRKVIHVSEQGHSQHPEDNLFLLADMFALWMLNKNWKGINDGLPE
jgi:hypothetical protein